MADTKIRVTVWNEFRHEKKAGKPAEIYPQGIHEAIAAGLRPDSSLSVRTATLDDPDQGVSEKTLAETDVLTWWGHTAHKDVKDETVARVQKRVLEGMGLIVLHSGHYSKIFKALMGTSCSLKWRDIGEREIFWVCKPGHPIAKDIDDHFVIEKEEMYGEHFDIPEPEETIFISSFAGGEVFRSGCTWKRGAGKIFYFRPGHETYPIYFDERVRSIIRNAVHWAAPVPNAPKQDYGNRKDGWWKA